MRISMFTPEGPAIARDGLARDRRGGSGRGYGGNPRQGRQERPETESATTATEPSIADLLGQALGQYHAETVYGYSR